MLCTIPRPKEAATDAAIPVTTPEGEEMLLAPSSATGSGSSTTSTPNTGAVEGLSPFFRLPFEIRSEIFYYMICVRALTALDWMQYEDDKWPLDDAFPSDEAGLCPLPPPSSNRQQGRHVRPWGQKPMASLLTVCRQWQHEVEVVLYSQFSFRLYFDCTVQEWTPHYLSFLPDQALPLIRSLHLVSYEQWNGVVKYETSPKGAKYFITSYEKIAALLPGLTKITLSFCYVYCEYPELGLEDVTPEEEAKFEEFILALMRPFKHIPDFTMAVWGMDQRRFPEEKENTGMRYNRLLLEIYEKHCGLKNREDVKVYYH